jgi:xanthine/CO dehydrogenase XdhC/CoxF family maturation factor
MLLTRFRWMAGSVSGGCLEGDLSERGWRQTRDGCPLVVSYDTRGPANGDGDDDIRSAFGLGCDGVVEVLFERAGIIGRIDALDFADRCVREQRRGAVATVFRSDDPAVHVGSRIALAQGGKLEQEAAPLDDHVRSLVAADLVLAIERGATIDRSYATPRGTIDVLIEAVLPQPVLFLCGIGHDAVPVAQLARTLGWSVVVCATRLRFSTRERFAFADELLVGGEVAERIARSERGVAVVMNHDDERDRESLAMLLRTQLQYIGVLGPRARTRRLLRELGCDDEDPRVHAPVGIEIGAETPQELALAIVAEVQAVLSQTTAAIVRMRPEPVREPALAAGSAAAMVAAPAK